MLKNKKKDNLYLRDSVPCQTAGWVVNIQAQLPLELCMLCWAESTRLADLSDCNGAGCAPAVGLLLVMEEWKLMWPSTAGTKVVDP